MDETPRLELVPWELADRELLAQAARDPFVADMIGYRGWGDWRWIVRRRQLWARVVVERGEVSEGVSPSENTRGGEVSEGVSPSENTRRGEVSEGGVGRRVGEVSLHREGPSASLSYWIVASARGRGLATKACRMMCRWGLQQPGIVAITAYASERNVASCRVLEKLGFQRGPHLPGEYAGFTDRSDTYGYFLFHLPQGSDLDPD